MLMYTRRGEVVSLIIERSARGGLSGWLDILGVVTTGLLVTNLQLVHLDDLQAVRSVSNRFLQLFPAKRHVTSAVMA